MPISSPGGTAGNTAAPSVNTLDIGTSIRQDPMLHVEIINQFDQSLNDVTSTCVGVDIMYGFDMSVSTASVQLTEDPFVSNYSIVKIYCSAGLTVADTPNYQGIPLRFTGVYLRTEATLWPHVFTVVCRGLLFLASQLQIPPFVIPGTSTVIPSQFLENLPVGILLFTNIATQNPVVNGLLPAPSSDAAAIQAILDLCAPLGLTYDPANIRGTTATFGTIVPLEFLWAPYRSALDVIQQFDQICLGFRTYDNYAGKVVRSQIFGYPFGDPITSFTEGRDIFEGSTGTRSVEQLCNASFVEGATLPDGSAGIINHYEQQENPFQGPNLPVIDQFSSPWIEASDLVPGPGLSAVDVALWRLSERNRELVTGQWVTYRDDILFPGYVIFIDAVHTAVHGEHIWIQRVGVKVTAEPKSFTQTIYGWGGGLPGYTDVAPGYNPPSAY